MDVPEIILTKADIEFFRDFYENTHKNPAITSPKTAINKEVKSLLELTQKPDINDDSPWYDTFKKLEKEGYDVAPLQGAFIMLPLVWQWHKVLKRREADKKSIEAAWKIILKKRAVISKLIGEDEKAIANRSNTSDYAEAWQAVEDEMDVHFSLRHNSQRYGAEFEQGLRQMQSLLGMAYGVKNPTLPTFEEFLLSLGRARANETRSKNSFSKYWIRAISRSMFDPWPQNHIEDFCSFFNEAERTT